MELSQQEKEKFESKMKNYNYLRQNRVSYWQAIYTAIIVTALLLILDFITRYFFKISDEKIPKMTVLK